MQKCIIHVVYFASKQVPHGGYQKTQASRGSFAANREAVGISLQYARNEIDTSPPGSQATPESQKPKKKHHLKLRGMSNGGFLKWWYPTTMDFPTKNDHFGVFWWYHHLRKHPNVQTSQSFLGAQFSWAIFSK